MAFREKSAWISLLATLVVYGVYAFHFGTALVEGRPTFVGAGFVEAVVLLVVIQTGLHVVLALSSLHEARTPLDERERLIQARASAFAFYTLQAGAIIAAATVYFVDKNAVANFILTAMALAQIAQYGGVILGYRRGR